MFLATKLPADKLLSHVVDVRVGPQAVFYPNSCLANYLYLVYDALTTFNFQSFQSILLVLIWYRTGPRILHVANVGRTLWLPTISTALFLVTKLPAG